MRRALSAISALTLVAAVLAMPAVAKDMPSPVPGGLIGTLEQGKYTCELPGDASGPIRVNASEFDFKVVRGSSYRSGGERGSYLLTGDLVQMTGGKLKGLKLHRVSGGFLRQVEANGQDGVMRCILGTPGNG